MTEEQLKALIDFISAKAEEVVSSKLNLADQEYCSSFDEEVDLYKAFGLDFFEEV